MLNPNFDTAPAHVCDACGACAGCGPDRFRYLHTVKALHIFEVPFKANILITTLVVVIFHKIRLDL